jgi:hypothetical protein
VGGAGGAEDRQLAAGLFGVVEPRRGQQARAGELVEEHLDAAGFVLGQVVAGGVDGLDELGHHALVHVGVLAQVDGRQVEAEHAHRPAQVAQAAAGQGAEPVGGEGAVDDFELFGQRLGAGVGADWATAWRGGWWPRSCT